MPKFFWDVQQGSADWYKLRAGIPTASEFHHVMTPKTRKPSESRKKYAVRLILERLMRWQADSLEKIDHIAAGKENEPFAVAQMELIFGVETTTVGFVKTDDGRFGASPDRIVKADGAVVEVKCPTPQVHLERWLFENADYMVQRQGQLLVTEADKAIFFSYHPRMPNICITDGRDEAFIKDLRDNLERFSDELEEWTERARRWGPFQAFEELAAPVEAAHSKTFRTGPPMSEEELEAFINGGGL